MGNFIDETSNKYGRLLVLCRVAKRVVSSKVKWSCLCDCGKTSIVRGSRLRSGRTKSCGCYNIECTVVANSRHGLASNKIFRILKNIFPRCYNKKHKDYRDYGGRGIGVCQEWRDNPGAFVKWAKENGHKWGLEIDRIDNNGDYGPGNCRFITNYVNQHNKRRLKRTNKSGYSGVYQLLSGNFQATIGSITFEKRQKNLGTFPDPVSAVIARNEFIKDNNLPHRIQEIL